MEKVQGSAEKGLQELVEAPSNLQVKPTKSRTRDPVSRQGVHKMILRVQVEVHVHAK